MWIHNACMNGWKEWMESRTGTCVSNSDKLEHRKGEREKKVKKMKRICLTRNESNTNIFWCKQTANQELKFNEIKLNVI